MSGSNQNLQRTLLIETGSQLFHRNGYTATGVREIASGAGLPQGSFTNHFRSKERFGTDVLDHYAAKLEAIMVPILRNDGCSGFDRISNYIDTIELLMAERDWMVGCLIPDMATEAAIHSDIIRRHLLEILDRHTGYFAAALSDEFGNEMANDLAAVILAAWHGTLLRMKVEQTGEAISRFKRLMNSISRNVSSFSSSPTLTAPTQGE